MIERPSVLIVDDDRDIAANVSDILQDVGYHTDVAHDGATALELAQRRAYDVALLDYKMPDMNGAVLFSRLREAQPGIIAIMITAYAGSDGVEEAKNAGTWQVLRKPVDVRRLLGFIENALNRPLILVVDDDVAFSRSLQDILFDHGYRVGITHDVATATGQLESRGYDLVLLDLKLGNQRADDAFRHSLTSGQMPPTILITGFRGEMQEAIEELIEHGAISVCYKPVDPAELIGLLAKKVDRI